MGGSGVDSTSCPQQTDKMPTAPSHKLLLWGAPRIPTAPVWAGCAGGHNRSGAMGRKGRQPFLSWSGSCRKVAGSCLGPSFMQQADLAAGSALGNTRVGDRRLSLLSRSLCLRREERESVYEKKESKKAGGNKYKQETTVHLHVFIGASLVIAENSSNGDVLQQVTG